MKSPLDWFRDQRDSSVDPDSRTPEWLAEWPKMPEEAPHIVADILSVPRRMWIIEYVAEMKRDKVEFAELVTYAAALENDKDPNEVTKRERKKAWVSIYQTHIPKLEQYDILEHDSQAKTVRAGNQAATYNTVIQFLRGDPAVETAAPKPQIRTATNGGEPHGE